METKLKLFKLITIISLITVISLLSFIGVFRNKLNFKENIIPEFKYGMELAGNREFKFTLDTTAEEKKVYIDENGDYKGTVVEENSDAEANISLDDVVEKDSVAKEETKNLPYKTESKTVKANDDAVLNKESYEKTKTIIQKRLEAEQIPEYNLRLNTITGDLVLEVPSDEYTDKAYNLASAQGKFEIIDADTGVILLDNSHLKKAQALYTANDAFQTYLQIEFTDEGAEILKNISKEYIETTDESGTTTQKKVELKLDNSTLLSTYFGEELPNGVLQITMGTPTSDHKEFTESYNSAKEFADIINNGKAPNKIVLNSDNFIQSQITHEVILYAEIAFAICVLIVSVILIIKYKIQGLLAAISAVGYIAMLLLVMRYTNVVITLNSVLALIVMIIVNYVFLFSFLSMKKSDASKHAFSKSIKKMALSTIPLWVIAVVFTFMAHVVISSAGIVIFWGLCILYLHNLCITKTLFV